MEGMAHSLEGPPPQPPVAFERCGVSSALWSSHLLHSEAHLSAAPAVTVNKCGVPWFVQNSHRDSGRARGPGGQAAWVQTVLGESFVRGFGLLCRKRGGLQQS